MKKWGNIQIVTSDAHAVALVSAYEGEQHHPVYFCKLPYVLVSIYFEGFLIYVIWKYLLQFIKTSTPIKNVYVL
jgi:hypothetical protein